MRLSLVGVVTALVVLAGCGGDPKAEPSPSPSTPTVSTSPSPTAPVMPAAAAENTKAGAIAFVRYYIELINHAQATGDVGPLEAAESSDCRSCQRASKAVTDIYLSGGHIEGGRWEGTVRSASPRPDLKAWTLFTIVRFEPQVVFKDGQSTRLNGGRSVITFVVVHTDQWKVIRWSRA
jgi:hypothetical protein